MSIKNLVQKYVSIPIGVDIGARTSSITTPFSSAMCDTIISDGKSSFVSLNDTKNSNVSEIYIEGEWFTVGESGLGDLPYPTFGTERLQSSVRAAMLHHLLKMVGLEGKNICLTSSIPTTLCINKNVLNASLAAISKSVKIAGFHPCAIKANLIQSEAVASVRALVWDKKLQTTPIIENGITIALIDMGGYTVDIAVLKIGNGIEYDKRYLCSLDGFGMLGALENFIADAEMDIKKQYPSIPLSKEKLETAFTTGKLTIQGVPIDLKKHQQNSLIRLSQRIYRKIVGFLPQDCDLYVFSGGGASTMEPFIRGDYPDVSTKWFENYMMLDNPIMACTNGNYRYSLATCLKLARKVTDFPDMSVEQLLECYE